MSKNVLVTGGSGFIGSHVVDYLIRRNYKVTILDLSKPKRDDVKFIKGSVLNKNLIQLLLKKNKLVFHLAAVSDINKVKSIPIETISTNILGTLCLLEASRKENATGNSLPIFEVREKNWVLLFGFQKKDRLIDDLKNING